MLTLATFSGMALFAQNEEKGQLSGNLNCIGGWSKILEGLRKSLPRVGSE